MGQPWPLFAIFEPQFTKSLDKIDNVSNNYTPAMSAQIKAKLLESNLV